MKKIIIFILMMFLSFSSCAFQLKEENLFVKTFSTFSNVICPAPCWRPFGIFACQCPAPDFIYYRT